MVTTVSFSGVSLSGVRKKEYSYGGGVATKRALSIKHMDEHEKR